MDLSLALSIAACLLFFLLLVLRRRVGLGAGEVISQDDLAMYSEHYLLTGRPDRIVKRGRQYIAEEKKSAKQVYDSHRLQMGVYMLLIEEHFGVRPSHGIIVLGDGCRHRIKNTRQLKRQVLSIAEQIHRARQQVQQPLKATPLPAKCRVCGQRKHCEQRAG